MSTVIATRCSAFLILWLNSPRKLCVPCSWGDPDAFRRTLQPTVPFSRHLFQKPTFF